MALHIERFLGFIKIKPCLGFLLLGVPTDWTPTSGKIPLSPSESFQLGGEHVDVFQVKVSCHADRVYTLFRWGQVILRRFHSFLLLISATIFLVSGFCITCATPPAPKIVVLISSGSFCFTSSISFTFSVVATSSFFFFEDSS